MFNSDDRSEPVIFKTLVIERFRGFNNHIEIPLDASAVVVSGANGQGKTSFFDAIQWLVLGKIKRLEELRFRKNEEYLINKYAPVGSKARVQAIIKDTTSNNWITVTRTGDYRGSVLEADANGQILVGQRAEVLMQRALGVSTNDEDTFGQYFLSAALLQQDLVRSFLSTYTHAERYEILSRLLGLSIIDAFNDKLGESEKHISEQVKKAYAESEQAKQLVAKTEQAVTESKARINSAPFLSEKIKELENSAQSLGLAPFIEIVLKNPDHGGEIVHSNILRYKIQLERLTDLIATSQTHLVQRPNSTLAIIEERVTKIKDEINEQRSKLQDSRVVEREFLEALEKTKSQTNNLRQLASLAIPMLGSDCPVCGQTIELEKVRARLLKVLGDQPELLEANKRYKEAQETTIRTMDEVSQLENQYRDAASDMERVKAWEKRANQLKDEYREIGKTFETLSFPNLFPLWQAFTDWIPAVQNWATSVFNRLVSLDEIAQSVIAARSGLDESYRLKRLEIELDHLIGQYNEKRNVVADLEKALSARKNLVELAREKATDVVRDAFDELEPVVQDLFSRLSPHPTFDRLSFSHELYRRHGSSVPLAIDRQAQLEVSPAIGFSSAQANVAALCYFLALAFASSEADFGFVLLDDPLQAMDDVNVLGFADLCRFLRKEKQLIIATHEERLSNLLVRKLISRDTPINTIRIQFASWNRSGPYIEVERLGPSPEESVLSGLTAAS